MIGCVSVQVQGDKVFKRALLKASVRRWKTRLRWDSDHDRLLSFDEAKGALSHWSQVYRGMRTVELERIIGSVGRYKDFDGSFLPNKKWTGERWSRIDRAYHQGVELPAVSLYKIGEVYYVRDGNHRVSVAKYHGGAAIDAEVVEIRGQRRPDATRRTASAAGNLAHRPQPAPRKGLRQNRRSSRPYFFALTRNPRSILRG